MNPGRRQFLRTSTLGLAGGVFSLNALADALAVGPKAARQPVMFIGHGSPMNIIRDNDFTRALGELGRRTEKPAAVLVVSAHWLTEGETRVCVNPRPPTIHDFGGFPEELYRVRYDAPGSPGKAREVVANVTSVRVHEDHEMGLDHGTWSVLRHMWPEADVPVFQLSIDYDRPALFHYKLGRELRKLRDRGVLVIGSGNLVHNLGRLRPGPGPFAPFDWALEFDTWVRQRLLDADHGALINYETQGAAARAAVPTPDHYYPMLYSLGLLEPGEAIRFTHESFQNASISMRCFESA